jgi:hypothetical protein
VGWALGGTHKRAMHGYIHGYRKAAVGLLERVRAGCQSPDYHVFPIAFLWRHHLELALKRIIAVGQQLADEPSKMPANHRLIELWESALPYIRALGDAPDIFENVRTGLNEIERLDPTAAGFRYPFEKNLTTVALKAPPSHVNLETLDTAMRAISNFLDGVHFEQIARLDRVFENDEVHR